MTAAPAHPSRRARPVVQTFRYAAAGSDLGRVVVAATARGVCVVGLGADDDELVDYLSDELATARLVRDDLGLRAWVDELLRRIVGEPTRTPIPLDVPATPFQRRVWDAITAIPAGQVRTYAELAAAIGAPTAVRAAARACATNPVAVVVPCHRVIGSDGRLTGYRWGLDRKRALLDREAARRVATDPPAAE